MLICGIKVSHDGGIAVIDGQRLVFSAEMEKLGNRRRYSPLEDLRSIEEILHSYGIELSDIDRFVVDGWVRDTTDGKAQVRTLNRGVPIVLPVAPYTSDSRGPTLPRRFQFPRVSDSPLCSGYMSYAHASQHVFASYSSSPFAARREDAFVLAWDGLMMPRLYKLTSDPASLEYLGSLFPFVGDSFSLFCRHLEPFKADDSETTKDAQEQNFLEIPGKAMAYAGLGTVQSDALTIIEKTAIEVAKEGSQHGLAMGTKSALLVRSLMELRDDLFPGLSNADLIATFQMYIGKLLVESMTDALRKLNVTRPPNLCLSGGCALNIKWNSLIRDSGLFASIWVPPFPNDSGAALGAACCEMVHESGKTELQWDVYSGPDVLASGPAQGWSGQPCDERAVAALLYETGEPVVIVDGSAELGPRALGNRSILAPAVRADMKDKLNRIKGRAAYRPIAPICLEASAGKVFMPGGTDRYMLFDHKVRPDWLSRVPAVLHVDGTARLQTITPETKNTSAGKILAHYERLSGIPLLCNTSANASGHGFFPDARAAMEWGQTTYVWSEGMLYMNQLHSIPEIFRQRRDLNETII